MASSLTNILCKFGELPPTTEKELLRWHSNCLQKIWGYYSDNKRYNYHEITQYILEIFQTPADAEKVGVIAENILNLLCLVDYNCNCSKDYDLWECSMGKLTEEVCDCQNKKDDYSFTCDEYKILHKFILKLYDHIQLECVRLTEIRNNNENLKAEYINISKQFKEKQDEIKNEIKQEKKQLKRQAIELKKEAKGIYLQVVSILGIFAAVIVAVFGSMKVFDTAIASFTRISILIFVLFTGMFFIFNIIFILLWFIAKMNLRTRLPDKIWDLCTGLNLVCIIGIFLSLLVACN